MDRTWISNLEVLISVNWSAINAEDDRRKSTLKNYENNTISIVCNIVQLVVADEDPNGRIMVQWRDLRAIQDCSEHLYAEKKTKYGLYYGRNILFALSFNVSEKYLGEVAYSWIYINCKF